RGAVRGQPRCWVRAPSPAHPHPSPAPRPPPSPFSQPWAGGRPGGRRLAPTSRIPIVVTASGHRAENAVFLSYHAVLVFLITGIVMVCTPLVLGALFRPKNPYPEKSMPYECAEDPVGDAQVRF